MSTTTDVARANGLVNVDTAWQATQAVGVPFWATCAFLEQESGGANVFGHDPGWYSGAGTVTKAKYLTYKAGRAAHNAQGVGPMQLTWPGFQDQADAAGGCWLPLHNITTGLRILKGYIDAGKTWHEAAAAYNGSEAYAVAMDTRFNRWQQLLAGATPPGGQVSKWGTRWGQQDYNGTGMKVTGGMAQALERIRVIAGESEPITMYQGSFNKGVQQSAQTHWGADVVDISPYNLAARAKAAEQVGLIMFHRQAIPGVWQEHCHCILRPTPAELARSLAKKGHINYQAAEQVLDWDQHKDGLADGAPYGGPWYPVTAFVWHPNYEIPKKPPPPPPPARKFPVLDPPREHLGDAIRSIEHVIAAHPKWQFGKDMLARWQADRDQLANIQKP